MCEDPVPAEARVFVAGHRGLVGSAIVRSLQRRGYKNVLTRPRKDLDLTDRQAVDAFFEAQRPEYVYLAAARVGGIWANDTYPVEFLQTNLEIQVNVIRAAHEHRVKKLLFLGSSCIYPRLAPQPIKEEYLLTGSLEKTNAPYAIAKIAGIELVSAYRRQYGDRFISAMPTNLYGPGDNFDSQTSHVLAALLRKVHEAKMTRRKEVEVWGTGNPRREFLYVDDFAEACLLLMNAYDEATPINVGVGHDISIRELAELIMRVLDFDGNLVFDEAKSDGTPRKLLDVSRIRALGWCPSVSLEEGIARTYEWYVRNATLQYGGETALA